MNERGPVRAVAALALVWVLAGCSATTAFSVLENTPFDEDQPVSLDTEGVVALDTMRFLAEQDGRSYYIARPADEFERSICLVIDQDGEAIIGCGGYIEGALTPAVGVTTPDVEVMLAPDGYDAEEYAGLGWASLHPNLILR
ncbi:hypothetical protein I6N91_02115 [Arthrobacter sp. MSA 4-2]|uniref:hypothetical protein n=1 Tax=Arthrobacter sp. MSA 4-2 TaxID=2794349 RepID=UPI0018E87B98|nr:hypothetical protein [Arthrobacter sp. MSA 4-2]MBJ2119773.1 hypothetical protein [Arthrobacter sp. MSA 4-2]